MTTWLQPRGPLALLTLLLWVQPGASQTPPSAVRLVGPGSRTCVGRVEVFSDGAWGTVCDDSWGTNDANVVCRQLGCDNALAAIGDAGFGQGTGPIFLDELGCSGNETDLFQCPHSGVGVHDCDHSEDASVLCQGATQPPAPSPPVRLVGGGTNCSGRVEVFVSGIWGTVCDDFWGLEDAQVVCRQVGCGPAQEAPQSARFGRGTGPIWLDDVACSGNETDIFRCRHNGLAVEDCEHSEDAGVVCTGGDGTTVPPTTPGTTPPPTITSSSPETTTSPPTTTFPPPPPSTTTLPPPTTTVILPSTTFTPPTTTFTPPTTTFTPPTTTFTPPTTTFTPPTTTFAPPTTTFTPPTTTFTPPTTTFPPSTTTFTPPTTTFPPSTTTFTPPTTTFTPPSIPTTHPSTTTPPRTITTTPFTTTTPPPTMTSPPFTKTIPPPTTTTPPPTQSSTLPPRPTTPGLNQTTPECPDETTQKPHPVNNIKLGFNLNVDIKQDVKQRGDCNDDDGDESVFCGAETALPVVLLLSLLQLCLCTLHF